MPQVMVLQPPWHRVTNQELQGTGRTLHWGQVTLQPPFGLSPMARGSTCCILAASSTAARTVTDSSARPLTVSQSPRCPRCPQVSRTVGRGGPSGGRGGGRGAQAASVWSAAIWMYLQQCCSNCEKIKNQQANLDSCCIFGIFEDSRLKPAAGARALPTLPRAGLHRARGCPSKTSAPSQTVLGTQDLALFLLGIRGFRASLPSSKAPLISPLRSRVPRCAQDGCRHPRGCWGEGRARGVQVSKGLSLCSSRKSLPDPR